MPWYLQTPDAASPKLLKNILDQCGPAEKGGAAFAYPSSLTFTKIVAASFDDKPVKPANWNRLLQTALVAGHKKMGSFEKLQKLAAVHMVDSEKTDEGYRYFPEVGFSVQRTDANTAWRGIVFVAQGLNFSVDVSFVWSNKEAAEHPGKSGTMRLYRK